MGGARAVVAPPTLFVTKHLPCRLDRLKLTRCTTCVRVGLTGALSIRRSEFVC